VVTDLTPSVEKLIDLAIAEDLGRGDVTSASLFSPDAQAEGTIVARESLVVAGLGVTRAVFERVDAAVRWAPLVQDGAQVAPNTPIAQVRGPARGILGAERTALNFLQRLSGVATLARSFAEAVRGTALRVTDTRKTTPGFRQLEKEAVRLGGASNHRFDLGAQMLIKDNHIALAGSVANALSKARRESRGVTIEVEVDTLAQLDEALAHNPDMVLLDNFDDAAIADAMVRVRAHRRRLSPASDPLLPPSPPSGTPPLVEVSGGVTLVRLPALARLGVDLVSVGALTHSARAVDLSLDVLSLDVRPSS
jgi:nicotinate-nucleotide pyrophosphorylase (carboxylating)